MNPIRILPVCFALLIGTTAGLTAQHPGLGDPAQHHRSDHGSADFLHELHQSDYSDAELAAIHDHFEVIHRSIEQILGLHNHEGGAEDAEALHASGEAAFADFMGAFEAVHGSLEDDHARAFTSMLFQHLLHAQASLGGEEHAHGENRRGHGDGGHG